MNSCDCTHGPSNCTWQPWSEDGKCIEWVKETNCPSIPNKVKNIAQIIVIFVGLIITAVGAYYYHQSANSEKKTNILAHLGIVHLGVGILFLDGMVSLVRCMTGDFDREASASDAPKVDAPIEQKANDTETIEA